MSCSTAAKTFQYLDDPGEAADVDVVIGLTHTAFVIALDADIIVQVEN
jgi:hypothetical protein